MKNSFLFVIKRALQNIIKQLFKHLIITTKDKTSERSFATIGSNESIARYSHLYLGKETNSTNSLRLVFDFSKSMMNIAKKSGLVILRNVDLAKSIRDKVVMQPNFIELEIHLPTSIEAYFKSLSDDAKNNLKKASKAGFSSHFSKDKDWIDIFYDQYYLPTMQGRHAEEAAVFPKRYLKFLTTLPGTEFLKVFLGDQCVASAVTRLDQEKYYCEKIGYLNGDESFLKMGVTNAIYQFRIERAYELGCKKIVLGGTPPFIENGVFKFKAKWQARINPDIYYNENYLLLNPSNHTCYEFLYKNSLIVYGLNNSLIVLSSKLPKDTKISSPILNDIESWYLLRSERADSYPIGMENLPEHLRFWYNKVN